MNELMKDKALLVVMAVGIFASGYYFHEYNVFDAHQVGTQAAWISDDPNALEQDLTASAASSIDNINLSDDSFNSVEDISTETWPTEDDEDF
jgi:hypothetical protein